MSGIALMEKNGDGCVALRGVRVSSELAGCSNKTLIEQTFVNLEATDIEAVYTFPLPTDASVCHFEVVTGDRVLTGKVEETDEAIDQYEEAINRGDAAFQMEQLRPDVFTISVGNLKPRQAVTIRITYVEPLEIVDGRIRLAFPTTLAPRYATDTGMDPLEAQIEGNALNPPHVMWVPYGMSFSLSASLGAALRDVVSPSHEVVVKSHGTTTNVRLSAELTEMNRDLVIDLQPESTAEATAMVANGPDGEGYVAVTWFPEFDPVPAEKGEPSETIFLVDCSGSMMGESIAQVRKTLQLCLRGMPEGDRFNIWRFGCTFEMMAPEPLACGEESRRQAIQYTARFDDCLGGTELHAPLSALLRSEPTVPGRRRIVLLTDGQVSNESAIVSLARDHADRNQIFSFGIGAASSQFLVKGLARATGGMSEFIANHERIEEKVLRTISRIASPWISDVRVEWLGADVDTAQSILPPVFDGDALRVVGRFTGDAPKKAVLKCRTPRGEQSWTVAMPDRREDTDVIALEWARQRIAELGDMAPDESSLRPEDRRRMIWLSKGFNLLCRLTRFIAVEHRSPEERNSGQPALREVPVMLAHGWGEVPSVATMAGGALRSMGASGGSLRSMRMGLGLLQQKLSLSSRMIQDMQTLQLSQMELAERIEQAVVENPVLEKEESEANPHTESTERENPDALADEEKGLQDYLLGQLHEMDVDESLMPLCECIISTLDASDGGYFRSNLEDLLPADRTGPEELAKAQQALALVQSLDPPGIASRDLRECLLAQLRPDMEYFEEMRTLISGHLEDLAENHLPQVQRITSYSLDTIREAWDHLRRLNGKPAAEFASSFVPSITPDILVERAEGGSYQVQVCDRRTPRLRISKDYAERLRGVTATPEEEYIKQKVTAAQCLIESIEKRRDTLARVAQEVVNSQHRFLEEGPEYIELLKMHQIADKVGVHVTTVNRAVDDKWIQTPRGVFPLKRFFVGGTQGADGEDVAWDVICIRLQEVVDDEDKSKPYSDDELVQQLAKLGVKVARRTITKCRKRMNIGNSRQRRNWLAKKA